MFFQQLFEHLDGLTISINVTKKEEELIISLTSRPMPDEDGKIDEKKMLAPVIITGTAQELDADFFNVIKPTIEKAKGIYVSTEAFNASVEKVAEDEKKEAERKTSSKSTSKAKSKKPVKKPEPVKPYKAELEKAEKLFIDKKYDLALQALQALKVKYKKFAADFDPLMNKIRKERDKGLFADTNEKPKKATEKKLEAEPEPEPEEPTDEDELSEPDSLSDELAEEAEKPDNESQENTSDLDDDF